MLLSDLPPDILNEVTSLILGLDVISLWCCGDHALNWKLSKAGGVKSFKLHEKLLFWPSLLRELTQLEYLSLVAADSDSIFSVIAPRLSTLASTVQILVLNFPLSHVYFLGALRLNPRLFHGLKTLECISIAPTSGLELFEDVKWPNLNFLTLRLGYSPVSCSQAVLRLSTLPRTLVHLNLHLNYFKIDGEAFPPNLTYFELHCVHTDPFVSLLPQTLSSLNYNGYFGTLEEAYELDWSQLPENLNFLKIACPDVTLAQIEALPRDLTELKISYLDSSMAQHFTTQMMQALPKKLKSCPRLMDAVNFDVASSLPRHWTGKVLGVELGAVHALPPGITKITVPFFKLPRSAVIQSFPPALTYLYITTINDHIFSILPAALKRLIVREARISENNLKSLPTGLQLLELGGQTIFPNYEAWKSLPREMTSLDIFCAGKTINDAPRVTAESSLWLPRCLVFLALDTIAISDVIWFDLLPTTLETLSMRISKIPFNGLLHLQHCRSLRTMKFNNTLATEQDVGKAPNDRINLGNLLRTLPSSLEEFTFYCRREANWHYSNDDLKQLPHRLITLVLPPSSFVITPDILPYLPSQFAYFTQEWFEDHIEEKMSLKRARERKCTLSIAPSLGVPPHIIEEYFDTLEPENDMGF